MSKLKFQTGFACCVGQFRDSSVVLIRTAVKFSLGNASLFSSFSQSRADNLCGFAVATVADFTSQRLVARAGRAYRTSGIIIDQLAVQVLVAAVNAQTWHIGRTVDLFTNTVGSTPTLLVYQFLFLHDSSRLFLNAKSHVSLRFEGTECCSVFGCF